MDKKSNKKGTLTLKESDYKKLLNEAIGRSDYAERLEKMLNKEVRDNNHLRDQLNAEMKKVRELEKKIKEGEVVSFRTRTKRASKPDPKI